MKQIHYLLIVIFIGICTLGIIFSRNGIINVQTDTAVYVSQIHFYKGEIPQDDQARLRSFKPFYGVVGAFLSNVISAEQALLVINVLFYFGLIISLFYMLKEIGFQNKFALIGSAWVATGYPVLKYGLALLTDISGWFFAVATITVFLIGLRKQNSYIFILSSCLAFVGSLCKETGILGLLFSGTYLFLMYIYTRENIYIKNILKISLPFIILESLFLYTLFHKSGSGISFLDWFLYNQKNTPSEYKSLFYLLFTELSAFSLLWLYSLYTGWAIFVKKVLVTKHSYILSASLLIATLPVLLWPMFLSRVLYIGYLAIIPCALAGLVIWSSYNKEKTKTFYLLSALPIISSITLFIIASGGSLFDTLKNLF